MVYGSKVSYLNRISGCYIFTAVLIILVPFLTERLDQGSAFAAVMVILTLFGLAGGVIQASSYALGGVLPGKYISAVMVG